MQTLTRDQLVAMLNVEKAVLDAVVDEDFVLAAKKVAERYERALTELAKR